MRAAASLLLLTLACGPDGKQRQPSEPLTCEPGWLDDGGTCVPEACGTGTWGELPVDDATVYVDINAAEGGDGSADAPLRCIQEGLDLAGNRGAELVAVAAGSYPGAFWMLTDHAGVHLAGRCQELVTVDLASAEDEDHIWIDTQYGEVRISGVRIAESHLMGVEVDSGRVRISDVSVVDSQHAGIYAYANIGAPIEIELERCRIVGNTISAIVASGNTASVRLDGCTLDATQLDPEGSGAGFGLMASDGASVLAEGCELLENRAAAVYADKPGSLIELHECEIIGPGPQDAFHSYCAQVSRGAELVAQGCSFGDGFGNGVLVDGSGSQASISDCSISDIRQYDPAQPACGARVQDGGQLLFDRGMIADVEGIGVYAHDNDSVVTLCGVTIQDIQNDGNEEFAHGIEVADSAVLTAESCVIQRSPWVGVRAIMPGTRVMLRDVSVRETAASTPDSEGVGIFVVNQASLRADGLEISETRGWGAWVKDGGSELHMRGGTVHDMQRLEGGAEGIGVVASGGALLSVEDADISRARRFGVLAGDAGTRTRLRGVSVRNPIIDDDSIHGAGLAANGGAVVEVVDSTISDHLYSSIVAQGAGTLISLEDVTISGTTTGPGYYGMTAIGASAEYGATITAIGLHALDNEGSALYVTNEGSHIACVDCVLENNEFAGATALAGGTLEIRSTTISSTRESANLGGGVGVYAADQWDWGAATMSLQDSVITDHPVAGVWVGHSGSYTLTGNTITGGTGLDHGPTTRCGDGVYAIGTSAWDGESGLMLQHNAIRGNAGAGLFLDEALATIEENTWGHNEPDLQVQGPACSSSSDAYDEVPDAEICPGWDAPVCEVASALGIVVDDIEPSMAPPPNPWPPLSTTSLVRPPWTAP